MLFAFPEPLPRRTRSSLPNTWVRGSLRRFGNGAAFRKGREFAAWLGLIPRQHSTGGKARLLGISNRGSIYLRRMFIHGARAVLLRVKYDTGRLGSWAHQLELRAPRNKVVVAIANKLARIASVVLAKGQEYRVGTAAAMA